MPFFILLTAIQIALLVHIVKTGRNFLWFWIVLLLPGPGSIVYIIMEVLPDWLNTRSGHQTQQALAQSIHPNKALKAAQLNYSISETVENATALAHAYMDKGLYVEARDLFKTCLKGFTQYDPVLLLDLVRAEMALENYSAAQAQLRTLVTHNPDYKHTDLPLLDARIEEQIGDPARAAEKYATLIRTYPGPEAKFRYAMLLKQQGDAPAAKTLLEGIVQDSKISGRHYNALFRDWVRQAKAELAKY